MRVLVLLLLTNLIVGCSNQPKFNPELKSELAAILKKDQGYRELYGGGISETRKHELLAELNLTETDFLQNERALFEENDSLNLIQVEKIIEEHGYPGKTLVGEPENEAAWFVIQHSNKIEAYFPLIKKAGQNQEIGAMKVAMMEDRMLMDQGKEQIYGTQAKANFLVENPSSQDDVKYVIWPIAHPEMVNELRTKAGFNTTVEEYATMMNIKYQMYSLEEVNEMNKMK